jgi:L-threonylcarbamoyladenylate synthase
MVAPAQDAADLVVAVARGEAVMFPTDTLPALAAHPFSAQRLWDLKARPAHKPLILMGANLEQLREVLALPWQDPWLQQAAACWPGACTLVLPMGGPLAGLLNPGGGSLGLRVPACPMAQQFLDRCGPLATTSVNRSGAPPAHDGDTARLAFPHLPLLAPLPWPAGSGQPSRVLLWQDKGWQRLR